MYYIIVMLAEITRITENDIHWNAKVAAYVSSGRPILIDYIFDPPDQIVPQRLYRYDVFKDYLSRHRDDFEFGFDLIARIQLITGKRSYGVYVVELDDNPNHVYVGQSWYEPEERLAQHDTGFAAFHAARPFKAGARGKLRRDLIRQIPRYKLQNEAEAMEAKVAIQLKKLGFRVEGGH
jgi:hypothetical protein